MKLNYPPLIGY